MSVNKSKFAAFDIDGTLFRSGLYREVIFEMMRRGTISSSITEAITPTMEAWEKRLHDDAFEKFEHTLTTMLDAEIPRLKISDFEIAAEAVLATKSDNVYVYTRNLIKNLKSRGYFLIAISGSQQELVEPFAIKYGFDVWTGQKWGRSGGYFNGEIIKTHTGKDKILRGLVDQHNLTYDDSYGVGDTNGDTGILSIVEHPIAFNPTRELLQKARKNGWKIVVERKSVAYELESHDGSYLLA